MTIDARIWISDVNNKVNNIRDADCTIYEEKFVDTEALSRFIVDHLEASRANHGAVERIIFSVDESKAIDTNELREFLVYDADALTIKNANDVKRLISEYDALMQNARTTIERLILLLQPTCITCFRP